MNGLKLIDPKFIISRIPQTMGIDHSSTDSDNTLLRSLLSPIFQLTTDLLIELFQPVTKHLQKQLKEPSILIFNCFFQLRPFQEIYAEMRQTLTLVKLPITFPYFLYLTPYNRCVLMHDL